MKFSVSQPPSQQPSSQQRKPSLAKLSLLSALTASMHLLGATMSHAQVSSQVSSPIQPLPAQPLISRKPAPTSQPEQTRLPQAVRQKVLAIASKEMGIPINQLKITAVRSQLWDGCLGVAGPEDMCQMIGIPGWQVIVTGGQQYGVYHLNQTADLIKRNPTTSGKGTVVPSFWQPDPNLVPPNTGEIIFQSVTQGGIAGQAYKTLLMNNGHVLRFEMRKNPPTVPKLIRQLTPQQVQAFVRTLQQNEFEDFLGLNYSLTAGADYFTIALMVPGGTRGTQYVDIVQNQTPVKLQNVIQAWNRIISPSSR